jgi:hypothetical protein
MMELGSSKYGNARQRTGMTDTLIAESVAAVSPSAVVAGFNHVATVTHDFDRLVGFHAQIFDGPLVGGR